MTNVVGGIWDSSGYSIHTKELIKALSKIDDIRLTTNLPPNWEKVVSNKELELIKKKEVKNEATLIITNPLYWRMNVGTGINIAYLIWEGDKVPISIIKEAMNPDIDYVLVASNHTKEAVTKTINESKIDYLPEETTDKIKVVHHGVNLDLFYPKEKPKDKLVFIANKGFRNLEDRGGIQYLLKAYIEEFTDKDNVELLIKINPAYGVPDINSIIPQLTDKKENMPKIAISAENVMYDKLVDFYNQGHVFVSPTRAEAFNLPCLEAMACGLPVITTNFGGQTDYVNKENGWLIGGKLEEVQHELGYERISWLTPDIEELKRTMRKVYNEQESIKIRAHNASVLARELSWDKTAALIKEIVDLKMGGHNRQDINIR